MRELEQVPMAIVGGIDVHRGQLTYDYLDTDSGEIRRGQIRPANRKGLRKWLSRLEGSGSAEFGVEACTGWRYVAEELCRVGCKVRLGEPAEVSAAKGPKKRPKTDEADARHLRELVQQGRVPESWIPPTEILEARQLIRLHRDLAEERGAWIQRVAATLFHQGVPAVGILSGRDQIADAELSPQGRRAVTVALRQIQRLDEELLVIGEAVSKASREQAACRALVENLHGVGWLLAYAIWAEMGDARRFSSSSDAVRYSGIDITVYASGDKRSKGQLSRQGSPLLRWALYEAAMAATHKGSPDHAYYAAVKARRQGDSDIALQSVARKVARRSYHILREQADPLSTAA